MTAEVGRLVTAMITPMTTEGEVDLAQTAELARALVASGTDSIVATGTTGEAPTLSDAEQFEVWRTVKAAVGPNVAVIAGATDNNTAASITRAKAAADLGMDGLLLTVPAYNKPTQAGLIAHFTAIAAATSLPCMLYNVPSRTASNMTAETTLALADLPNVFGIKEASASLEQIAHIIEHAPEGFRVWSGNDGDTLPILAIGGFGVVSVASHLAGKQISEMMAAAVAGDLARAGAIHRRLMPLVDALFYESSPQPLKYALNHLGFTVGTPRLPLVEASAGAQALVRTELTRHQIDLPIPATA
ncbi:MAG: 4-hydroxy-tetrahydrodipicolinate synthase [Chloroflexi bacterium]|nr:4-hydroxy-tetrahydrodipicolinate synthase [Chloroflexota bacterium]MDA1146756.1 4-hydroxy-tetrahydrodipicolinate synthase [Chloroflexota bacterium]MQC82874.1 4-hydroxy-tetrahydrodipicolinate synthase [Chloroflexota bacterium]